MADTQKRPENTCRRETRAKKNWASERDVHAQLTAVKFWGQAELGFPVLILGLLRSGLQGNSKLSRAIPFESGDLPLLQTLKLLGDFVFETKVAEWVSNLSFFRNLEFVSLILGNPHEWLQIIRKHIPNLTGVILDLSYNNLTSSIFQGNFNFGSNLEELDLSNCSLMDTSFLVSSTSIMNSSSSLVVLRLSTNLFTSSNIFHWIFNFTTNIHTLDLGGNLLEGLVPIGFDKPMNSLEYLDLSLTSCKEIFQLCLEIFARCRYYTCHLTTSVGTLQTSFKILHGATDIFRGLSLSDNRITGVIPKSIELLSDLEYLNLQNNCLKGEITESYLMSFSKLKYLYLSHNLLSLNFVPNWIPPFQIVVLELVSCRLGPSFPSWLLTQNYIDYLDISDAGIHGFVPESFWYKLQLGYYLNMSHNNFEGVIPTLPKGVENWFKDPEFGLKAIDLSGNQLTREIPKEIGYLVGLNELNLSRNNLKGEIPSEIENLTSLDSLDLSRNDLCGRISSSLSQIDGISALDLSYNNLSGRIPSGRHKDTFGASFLEGNPNLCGEKLHKTCPEDITLTKPQEPTTHDDVDDNSDFYEALYMSLGFGFFTGFCGLLGPLLFWRPWRIAYLRFLNKWADYIYVIVD
ncbi:receptor-like protein EIX2 [Arachis stenosperma]|uniref:receptor-like protein EIX2 n=1 Tax=Arachis stenosperma TaxID=217475 RepID=UPI0025AC37AA|nr:receptor-like protein EIX2 [Arachis stenosperma]